MPTTPLTPINEPNGQGQASTAAPLPPPAPKPDDKKPRAPFSTKTVTLGALICVVALVVLIQTLSGSKHKPKLTTVQKERATAAASAQSAASHTTPADPQVKMAEVLSKPGSYPSASRSTTPEINSQSPSDSTLYSPGTRPATTPTSNSQQAAQRSLSPLEQLTQTRAAKEIDSLNSVPSRLYPRQSNHGRHHLLARPATRLQHPTTTLSTAAALTEHRSTGTGPGGPCLIPSAISGRAQGISPPLQSILNASVGPGRTLFEGTYLDAVLTTRMNGTFAGPVNCMITTNIWSHDRLTILIPQGAHVLGEARRVDTIGQQRLAVVFHRIIMPDGYSVSLDQFIGLNQIGETGLKDKVDNHYIRIFGTSIALGAIAGLSSLSSSSNGTSTSSSNFSQGFSQTISQEAMQILNKYLNILPTVIIREGTRLKIYLTNDLVVPAYADHRMASDL